MCCDHSNETSFSVLFMVMFVSVLVFFVCLFFLTALILALSFSHF